MQLRLHEVRPLDAPSSPGRSATKRSKARRRGSTGPEREAGRGDSGGRTLGATVGRVPPMSCHRTAAVLFAVLAVVGCGGRDEQVLPARVLRAIEGDPGFRLMPPGSKVRDQASRRVCVDASGDVPTTWRELDVAGWQITALDTFFRTELPQHGWTADPEQGTDNDFPSSSQPSTTGGRVVVATSRWSRDLEEHRVVLHIWRRLPVRRDHPVARSMGPR